MRIGVLGGAFDPPHAAHAALARAARLQLGLDLIVWVPTFAPPHKGGPAASFADRVAMTRLLAHEDSASEVSDIEAVLPAPSYTLHTLKALKARFDALSHGADSWHLILGADNAAGFPTWHQPEAVLAEASLAVYPRKGFTLEDPRALPPGTVMLNFPEMPDQSTEFRGALVSAGENQEQRETALERLPPIVAEYIREHGLYRSRA